jgi:hypothetical protein
MMPLALIRPSDWNLPLFVHVLGAIVLVGSMFALVLLALGSRRGPNSAMFARLAFRSTLLVVLPAFIVMRGGAAWIESREYPSGASEPGWLGVGFAVADPGVLVVLILIVLGWRSVKAGGGGWAATATTVLAGLYLVALGVAMFAMSAKPT